MQRLCVWKPGVLAALLMSATIAQAAVTVTKAYLNPVTTIGDPETENNTPAQGDVRTLRIDVINSGGLVTAGALTDNLPAQLRIAPVPNARASASCVAPAISASAGGGTISYTGATVPAQAGSVSGLCSVYVDVVSTVVGNWDNTIAAGGFTGSEAGVGAVTNGSAATRTLIVSALNPLTVGKAFSPGTIRMGENSTITITVTNPNAGRSITITGLSENLPSNVTATGTTTGGTCGAGTASGTSGNTTITLNAPVVVAGSSSCTVTWAVTGNAANGNGSGGTNTVPANSVLNDRALTHTAATAGITVQSPIALSKQFSQSPARAGEDITLTIRVQNRSAAAISNVSYTDNLPTGATTDLLLSQNLTAANLANCGAGTVSGVAGGNAIGLSGATIAAGETCVVTALVSAAAPNTSGGNVVAYANTIASASWSDVHGNTQATGSASASVTFFSQLTATKTMFDPSTGGALSGGLVPGGLVRYRVTLSNYSPAPIAGVSVTDPLPAASGAQMVVASTGTPGATAPSTTCPAGGSPSASGDLSAVFTGLTVPGGIGANAGTCYVQFDALVPAGWPVGTTVTNTVPRASIGPGLGQTDAVGSAPSIAHFPIAKAFVPASVTQGQVSRLTVSLINNGFDALTSVSVSDPLPASGSGQLRVANPANTATTCGGTASYDFGATRGVFNVSGLTVPRRANCSVSVDVVAGVAGTYANDADASGTDSRTGSTITPAAHALANLTVTPTFNTTKTFTPSNVAATGGVSRVTITVSNIGSGQLTGLSITDPLPAGLVIAATPDASTTCAGPTSITAVAGAGSATLTGAQLPASTSCALQFNVVTTGSAGAAASINTLAPGAIAADGGVLSNTATSATLTKIAGAGVPSLNKAFNPASLTTVGQPSRMTITLMNSAPGAIALSGVGLVDAMPDGMVLADSPLAVTTCSGGALTAAPGAGTLTLAGATLAAGATCTVEANTTLTRQGTFINTLAAGVLTNDQNVSNTLPVSANLGSVGAVGLQKAFSPVSVAPGESSLLTITVINAQPVPMNNLSVIDPLPAGLVPATPSSASTSCGGTVSTTSTEVRLTGGTLAAAGSASSTCTITVNMVAATGGTYVNTIPVGNVTATGGVSNTEPVSGTLHVRLPLTIAKAFGNATRTVNQANRLTVTVTNPNPVPVTEVSLTDTFPAEVFNTATPAVATTCAGGTVTAPPSDNFMRLTGATVPANGSCTFSANVLSNTPGTYVNTIADSTITSLEGLTNTNPASASFTVLVPPTLGKSFSPVQIAPGANSLLRIELGNSNATALTLSSALTDTLPQSPGAMTLSAAGVQAGTTCQGAVTANNGGTTVTYASGASIPAGGCTIVVRVTATVAGQYANLIPAGGLSTNGGNNPEPATAVLSISTRNSLTGRVYLDRDDDGVVDAAEPGVSGQTVELLNAGGTVIDTTITDSLGNYAFLDIADGTYSVRQPAQPAGTLGGRTTAGTGATSTGAPTGKAVLPSAVPSIVLAGAQNGVGFNFGEIEPSSIAGKVFLDQNNDGTQQSADSALPGVQVQLSGTDDLGAPVSISTTTAADGSYSFAGLRPGTYTVTEPTQPAGTVSGRTLAGTGSTTAGTATTPAVTPSAIAGIVLAPRQQSVENNFAEIPSGRSIAGRVYVDAAGNNSFESGDTAIAVLTVTLTGTDINGLPVTRTTVTAADGSYTFNGLPAGTYGVSYDPTALPPATPALTTHGNAVPGSTGGTAATRAVQLTGISLTGANTQSSGNDLTRRPAASVAGMVYLDVNENGARDGADSALAAVTLVLTGTDFGIDGAEGTADDVAANLSTTTATDGSYRFDVRPGRYVVTEPDQPAGTLNGTTHAGTVNGAAMGSATSVATTPSAISAVLVAAGQAAIDNDFGEILSVANLLVSKSHTPALFTAGHRATYTLRVRNGGSRASDAAYTVTDRLPTGLTIAVAPTGTGWSCTGAAGATTFSCTSSTVLAPSATHPGDITVQVDVAASVAAGTLHNAVMVEGVGERTADLPTAAERNNVDTNPAALAACVPAVSHNACRDSVAVQLPAAVTGSVWYDVGSAAGLRDGTDSVLANWTVELFDPAAPGTVIASAQTAADGSYRIDNLLPGTPLGLRFRDPQSNVVWGGPVNGEQVPGSPATCYPADNPPAGQASSCVMPRASMLRVVLAAGQTLPQQSLPVVPSGVVYDAIERQAVPGAVVTLTPVGSCPGYSPATAIVGATLGGYTVSGDAISMTVGDEGLYQFLFSAAAPANCRFAIVVTPPAGFVFTSATIPAETTPLNPGGGTSVSVQPQATAPTAVVGTGTTYYLSFDAGSAVAALVNNHLALDPANATGLLVTKTGNRQEVEVGDTLMYTLTVRHTAGPAMHAVTLRDRLPAGFTYIRGTARINGAAAADPRGGLGPVLAFDAGALAVSGSITVNYRVRVGVGSMQGDGINRVRAHGCAPAGSCVDTGLQPITGAVASNEAAHRVKVSGGVFTNDACLAGKVFVDANNNHVQDMEELGIPGVRLYMEDGTWFVTDSEGKYSMCGITPRSHVLKLDPTTLPRGSRLITSSNRNLGDAGSLWLDVKNGELHRGDFIVDGRSNTVIEQVKARRAQGEVRAPETEKRGTPALRFDSKPRSAPSQATDSARQGVAVPSPRIPAAQSSPPTQPKSDCHLPVSEIDLQRAPAAPAAAQGDANVCR
jgi:uncharacterized repeat protein (TIGR01451 family)